MVPRRDGVHRPRRRQRRAEPVVRAVGDDAVPHRRERRALGARAARPRRPARAPARRPREDALPHGHRAHEPQAPPAVVLRRGRGSHRRPAHREALLLPQAARGAHAGDGLPPHDRAARPPPPLGPAPRDEVPFRPRAKIARRRARRRGHRLPGPRARVPGRAARPARAPRRQPAKMAQPRRRLLRAARLPPRRRPARHPLAHDGAAGRALRARERGRRGQRGDRRARQRGGRRLRGVRGGRVAGGVVRARSPRARVSRVARAARRDAGRRHRPRAGDAHPARARARRRQAR